MEAGSEAKMEKRDMRQAERETVRRREGERHTAVDIPPSQPNGETRRGKLTERHPLPHDLLLGTPTVAASPPSALPPSLLLLSKPIKLLLWPQLKVPRPREESTEEASLLPPPQTIN